MGRTCSVHVLPMFCACSFHANSMKNLLPYCGLVDATISVSKKTYRISANSFRGNYSFLNLALCTVTFGYSTVWKLFKGGNYSRKYGICTRDLGYLGQQVFSLFQLEKKTKFYKMFTICGLHSYIFLEKNICNILFNYSMLLRREHKKGCNLLNC